VKTLFWYAVIKDPTKDEADAGDQPILVIPPRATLANDEQEVRLLAAREIPENVIGKEADRIRIAVSPF
jgi:hypothetical protein